MGKQGNAPRHRRLRYQKGDLIVKQGDYGLSIYKIVSGKVTVFRESGVMEIPLATLNSGEIIGEMAFLARGSSPRAASARALEDSELEIWHPSSLLEEYEKMPPVIKYIVNQALTRLNRTNQLVARMTAKRPRDNEKALPDKPGSADRAHYRKEVNCDCTYRPVDSSPSVRLTGWIRDISMGGIRLDVRAKNPLGVDHRIGDEFLMGIVLPNNKEINVSARIVNIKEDRTLQKRILGMEFVDFHGDSGKTLGFFLTA
ncbi:MAG: cyclic nucleotide-binding domain-containing protein [Thermodesulfobacteriota bacterium]|nr:cyclic nucleotide-binding domain-containing protein [Thermodesulfobacteriota bacterium]